MAADRRAVEQRRPGGVARQLAERLCGGAVRGVFGGLGHGTTLRPGGCRACGFGDGQCSAASSARVWTVAGSVGCLAMRRS
ncbi:hypothetical protein KCH_07440 [Kitasatospora cheerisanensis KCTC 2395]|uniref:Uncharacterized protein n=1 Tax=Kitasatospora cheerisanensis KCTC 2395 TaxID=1348663 RepID=A0A066ZBE8_9ACTN|nr:hypothetical protein KCH_07440 [Kitasatospora cheerisanensis KCTC 2395]